MSSLQGKKILFFAPKFFNYEVAIKEELEHQGAVVHLYDERNNPSSLEKVIIRKCPYLLKSKIEKYYKWVIDQEIGFSPDFIFFMSPETVTKKCVGLLKKKFTSSKFILYMYDSIHNKNAKHIFSFFDRCLSFDPDDCRKYNFIFRPLFYIKSFESKPIQPKEYKYDFSFIGTIHSDRAKILYKLKTHFDANGMNYYYYLYLPGKMMYFAMWILNKYVRRLAKNFIHTESIAKSEISFISESSKCIIDINHPKQVGLTMRTIEMLGMKQKILTTNEHIKEYDFYSPVNQIVFSRSNLSIPNCCVSGDYIPVDVDIYKSYSLSSWITKVFEI